jgi:hypothetical protein
MSGGFGGHSIREHCVSWMCASNSEGRSLPGGWSFDLACTFAESICYGPLPAIAKKVFEVEFCFDDDPEDLIEVTR